MSDSLFHGEPGIVTLMTEAPKDFLSKTSNLSYVYLFFLLTWLLGREHFLDVIPSVLLPRGTNAMAPECSFRGPENVRQDSVARCSALCCTHAFRSLVRPFFRSVIHSVICSFIKYSHMQARAHSQTHGHSHKQTDTHTHTHTVTHSHTDADRQHDLAKRSCSLKR